MLRRNENMTIKELTALVERATESKVDSVSTYSKEIVFFDANGDVLATYYKSTGRLRVRL
jgi:hypothetical protein